MADPGRSGPPPEALAYLKAKGYKSSFNWRDVWGEEHAHAFTVAKAMEHDVLVSIRGEVERALEDGVTLDEFKRTLTPRLKKLGWWGRREMTDPLTGELVDAQLGSPRRLDIIYWANTRSAYAAGQWERAQRTKRALPYFVYELGPSEVHRPHHVALADAPTILPVDHPFWDTHYPPNGWGCKCRLGQITRTEAERLGGVSADPTIDWRAYVNKRTGETTRVPAGIDPGWHINPGKARARTLMRGLAERIEMAGEEPATDAIRQFWRSRAPEAYAKLPVSQSIYMPAGWRADLAADLNARAPIVAITSQTLGQKLEIHGPSHGQRLTPQVLAELPRMIAEGEITPALDPRDRYLFAQARGRLWRIVIRRAATRYLRIMTLHETDAGKLERAVKKKKASEGR